jgi:DNA-binding FadR family transcriptional regulator
MGTSSPKNLRIQVAEALAMQILDGTYKPGQAMPTEPELMQITGVSRTTLRSAIQNLEAKGLINVGPSLGTRVQPMTNWNLLDAEIVSWRLRLGVTVDLVRQVYEMRECFEPRASLFAAERGTEEDHARISIAFDRLSGSRNLNQEQAAQADVDFHLSVLLSCGNDYIASFAMMMTAMLRMSFEIARQRKDLSQDDIDMHAAIFRAVVGRKGEQAEAATRQLLLSSKKVQMDAAEELEKATRVTRAMSLARTR